ncbi:MAG: UvrB/UvrC motif-containing protein, partial [Candidatus Kaiserbacteria bacterium]|nr:UvrB/UvrC motif-containing protein [Candidatus Kaiserbacteria bacterium]
MQKANLEQFNLPDEPGIYQFKQGRKILYVGKAASLRDRVRSYFSKDLGETRSPAIVQMVQDADSVAYTVTESVLEALILEANLIKTDQPPYNVASKDNKSFNYVVVTKERFPRVLIVRGRELFQNWKEADIKNLYGPFPHGLQLQEAMKIVRKIFPFRDSKCTPCEDQAERGAKVCRPCFNRQIGLCPGVCTGEISRDEYAQRVKHITLLFSGNFQGLKRELTKEMKAAAKVEDFEKAERLRRQCSALEHIKDVSLIKNERISAGGGARVEAYDVAHTSGVETVGVMTVVNNGEKIKNAYRKFKIQTATNDDVAALVEMLERRLNHDEWPLPRVFVVDGGKGQMRAAERTLKKAGVFVPIVGVVKNERHQPERLIGDERAITAYERDILLANNEAHRFGITWHRQR